MFEVFIDECLTLDVDATRKRIGNLIVNSGLTDRRIGEIMNLSIQSVNKWRNCKNIPDVENLYTLSRILGVAVDDMFVSKADVKIPWEALPESKQEHIRALEKRITAYYCGVKESFQPSVK